MSRDKLIEEIRRAQRSIRRPPVEPPAHPPPVPSPVARADDRGTLRNLLSELASRLDRTQEQLLARLGDIQVAAHRRAPGTPAERELYQEILSRLEPKGAAGETSEPRLLSIERSIERLAETLALRGREETTPPAGSGGIERRLEALEDAVRDRAANGSADLEHILGRLETLRPVVPPSGESGVVPVLAAIETRLAAIEERCGGATGAAEIATVLSRVGDALARIVARLDALPSAGAGSGADGELSPAGPQLAGLEEKLERLAAQISEEQGGGDAASKAVSTLKRDFSLLVHTINGHLQESRHRSDQVESTLEELKKSLIPIAKQFGVDHGGPGTGAGD